MKIYSFLSFLTLGAACFLLAEQPITVSVSSSQTFQTPIIIIPLDHDEQTIECSQIIKKCLNFTDQFCAQVLKISENTPKQDLLKTIKKLYHAHSVPLCLCINKKNDSYEWRLYDTLEGKLIAGKEYKKRGTVLRGWAYAITDKILNALTGTPGSFSSRITYCKEVISQSGTRNRALCIADFDGSNPEILLADSKIIISPCWNNAPNNPLIFYSEYTDTNTQLKSISLTKTITTASDLDGINMLPCFSPDGKSVVYCASNGKGNCQLYYHTKNKLHCFTRNSGNNISPCFIDNDTICFCSDAQTGSPQIYIGNLKTGHVQRITHKGYCSAPSYCNANNTILYHTKVDGVIQICLYDCTTKQHTVLTHDKHNKHAGSWSPYGDFIVYAEGGSSVSRVVNFNVRTKKKRYITGNNNCCLYPNCSPLYTQFPTIS